LLNEIDYGATQSTEGLCVTDRFFIFEVKMVDLIGQNILFGIEFYIFLEYFYYFFKIVRKSLDLIIMSYSK
jgi:hypothetical protein